MKGETKTTNKARCDSCGTYYSCSVLVKAKGGLKYCYGCESLSANAQSIKKDLKGKDLNKMMKDLLNTPPRKKTKDRS